MKANITATVHMYDLTEDDIKICIQRDPDTIALSLGYDLTIFLNKEQAELLVKVLPKKLKNAIAEY